MVFSALRMCYLCDIYAFLVRHLIFLDFADCFSDTMAHTEGFRHIDAALTFDTLCKSKWIRFTMQFEQLCQIRAGPSEGWKLDASKQAVEQQSIELAGKQLTEVELRGQLQASEQRRLELERSEAGLQGQLAVIELFKQQMSSSELERLKASKL